MEFKTGKSPEPFPLLYGLERTTEQTAASSRWASISLDFPLYRLSNICRQAI
jgi:hypothetical protein